MSVAMRGRRAPAWSETAIAELLDVVRCPACRRATVTDRRCPACGADFSGRIGHDLWQASQAAADALRARQSLLARVPLSPTARPERAPTEPADASPAAASATDPFAPAPAASATVQSVLAVAGAGLVAIAAAVFVFFNPDLTGALPRSLVMGAIAAGFLGGAAILARTRLQFSAEAVGALGAVFLALTVTSMLPLLPAAFDAWVFAGLATLASAAGLAALGLRCGIRSWLWLGPSALAFVPVMLAAGAGSMPATTAGCLTSAAAASALVAAARRLGPVAGRPLTAAQITLTVTQGGFMLAALSSAVASGAAGEVDPALAVSATLLSIGAVAAASARHLAGPLWSGVAGAAAVGAVTVLPLSGGSSLPVDSWFGVLPAAAGAALVALGALRPLHRAVSPMPLFAGAIAAVAAVAAIPTLTGFLSIAVVVTGREGGAQLLPPDAAVALTLGLAALAGALVAFAAVTDPRLRRVGRPLVAGTAPEPLGMRWPAHLGAWYAVLAFLTVLCLPTLEVGVRVALGLAVSIGASALVATRGADASASVRLPLIVGAHAAIVMTAVMSWRDPDITVTAGVAALAAVAVAARTVPRRARFVHVGAGLSYALAVLATALARAGLDAVVVLCLTTCAAGVVAIGATFARRVSSRDWHAVLVVTTVPFVIGVVQVVFERSGWTALSTAVIFLLALTLVTTTRSGLGVVVRTAAAAALVPSVAVVTVCLGAQLLATSGSPVVLPVIAAVVAAVLSAGDVIRRGLARRIAPVEARAAGVAIEASALVTAAIAVALSLTREAAGLGTALVVLVVLGIGFAASAVFARRRYGWWLAGGAFTGALWCAWGIAGVTGLEPYLLPPTLGAAAIGALLTARGLPATGLYAAGLVAAVVPMLIRLAVGGDGDQAAGPARAYALVGAAWALAAAGALVARATARTAGRLQSLRTPTLSVAILAAAASAVEGVRWGWGLDPAPALAAPVIVACLALGALGAGAAAWAARSLRAHADGGSLLARTRMLGVPAVLYVSVATWPAIDRDWFAIWTMWGLMIVLLAFLVAVAVRGLRAPTGLPPVPFVFAVAFVTAVVAWSPRDLRVEWFSLPLGIFLLAAGAVALRVIPAEAPAKPSLWAWPTGWTGSWPLLGPGLVVMLSASVAATYTDPRTWRAILVMAIALVAILVGATRRLAAPFIIGIVVLPVENVLAFLVQIGRGIEAMPWWITLSVVGAVLLIIAVGYERRAGDGSGIAARLRDLA
ncbi:SCO7613 C-terminal domain-containing membrane protein [Microbacterium cremeum]|uniref:SCO7613 C-terminal domain-containing membrane protein n=1 Tax=Microbacterium cremeum TaxID=2782169 RepID=UPI001888364D|nr:hypothetical protein [Microbacterium cremeum]